MDITSSSAPSGSIKPTPTVNMEQEAVSVHVSQAGVCG